MPRPQFRWRSRNGQSVTLFGKTYPIAAYYGLFGWIKPIRERRQRQGRQVRYYINLWYVPAWIALSSLLLFSDSLAVAPPRSKRNVIVPKYKDIMVGTGFSVSTSVIRTLYLAYLFDLIVVVVLILQVRDFLAFLISVTILGLLTWMVQIRRICWAFVITPDNLIEHTGIWQNAEQSSTEAQSIRRVIARSSNPKILSKIFGIMDVVVEMQDGSEKVIRGVDNGESIRDLIIELQHSLETAQKDHAASQEKASITNREILEELKSMNDRFDEMGRLLAIGIREQSAYNAAALELLRQIANLPPAEADEFVDVGPITDRLDTVPPPDSEHENRP